VAARQLEGRYVGITSVYRQDIDKGEVIEPVHAPPRTDHTVSASLPL
jgi:hypothetical protein